MFLDGWNDTIRAFSSMLDRKRIQGKYAPYTVKNYLVVVKSFLKCWDIPLKVEVPKHLYVKYHNRDLTKEHIRLILSKATQRDRTIWLLMAESGLRAGTVVSLKFWMI